MIFKADPATGLGTGGRQDVESAGLVGRHSHALLRLEVLLVLVSQNLWAVFGGPSKNHCLWALCFFTRASSPVQTSPLTWSSVKGTMVRTALGPRLASSGNGTRWRMCSSRPEASKKAWATVASPCTTVAWSRRGLPVPRRRDTKVDQGACKGST